MLELELGQEFEIVRKTDNFNFCLVKVDYLIDYIKEHDMYVHIEIDSEMADSYGISKYLQISLDRFEYMFCHRLRKDPDLKVFITIDRSSVFLENSKMVDWHREQYAIDKADDNK